MTWFLLALGSALFQSAKDISGKSATVKRNEYEVALAVQMVEFLMSGILLSITGVPEIRPAFLWELLGAIITVPLGQILYLRALRRAPLSEALPLIALNPIFTAFIAFLFDGKLPTVLGWSAIGLIVLGMYLAWNSERGGSFLSPFVKIFRSPAFFPMLGVSIVWAFGGNIAASLTRSSSVAFGWSAQSLLSTIILFVIARIANGRAPSFLPSSLIPGLFAGLSNLCLMSALAHGFTPYVISIKRTSMVWSSLFGRFWFEEKVSVRKYAGMALELCGIALFLAS